MSGNASADARSEQDGALERGRGHTGGGINYDGGIQKGGKAIFGMPNVALFWVIALADRFNY